MSNKIIILGSSGYLGSNIFNNLKRQNFDIIGISRNISNSTTNLINDYFKDFKKVLELLDSNDVIINCLNDDKYVNGNTSFIEFLLSKINFKIRIIQISSLSVYISNEKENFYNENSMLNPVSNYGKIKYIIERTIINNNFVNDYLILRIGGVFGKRKLPYVLKLKKNKFFYFFLKFIFYRTKLRLISIYNLNKMLVFFLNKENFDNQIINIFYEHDFINSDKSIVKVFLKNSFFKKYYLNITNEKMKENININV